MNFSAKWIAAAALGLGALGVAAVAWSGVFGESPGGMRPTYPAADGDPRLTRTALPIIAALDRYRHDHGAFPEHAADPWPYLPDARGVEQGDRIDRWRYFRAPASSGYTLSLKLGWDPDLEYHRDGDRRYWVFNPGDGSEERTVTLDP